MPNDRIPKQVFFGQLAAGKRLPGVPIKRYKNSFKENLKKCGFQPKALCEEPLDAKKPLLSSKQALEMKRAARKQAALPSMDVAVWSCSRCCRVCTSRIGLSHQRTHR